MRAGRTIAMCLALAGCQGAPPEIVKTDGSFVTVSQPRHTKEAAAKEVANSYCRQQGLRAVFLSDACPEAACAERSITYWCR
jgi:putative hemolysin